MENACTPRFSAILKHRRGWRKDVIAEEPGVRLDYFEVVNPETLDPVSDISHGALVAVAAFVGSTRLIDNVVLHGASESREPSVG